MLPNLSVFWVIAFVLILIAMLEWLLFRPISRVMGERARRIESAQQLAEDSSAKADAAAAEFEAKVAAARADLYRQMDEMRRAALQRRADLVAKTKKDAEATVADAKARIQADAAAARARLSREADALGAAVAERILGQKAS